MNADKGPRQGLSTAPSKATKTCDKILTATNYRVIFTDVLRLLDIHQPLLADLKRCLCQADGALMAGQLFADLAPKFKIYISYVHNLDSVLAAIRHNSQQSLLFRSLLCKGRDMQTQPATILAAVYEVALLCLPCFVLPMKANLMPTWTCGIECTRTAGTISSAYTPDADLYRVSGETADLHCKQPP